MRSDNLNEARLYGFESGMRYLASVGAEFYAVLNYTRGDESSPDGATTAADRIPPLSGRLGLLWEPGQRWRIEPHIDFAAAQDRLSPRDESDPRIRPGGTAGWGSARVSTRPEEAWVAGWTYCSEGFPRLEQIAQ